MKCPSCGKEIAEDSNFCEYCGESVATREAGIQSYNEHIPREESSKQSVIPSKVWLGVCSLEGVYFANQWGGRPETWAIALRVFYVILSILMLPVVGLLAYIIGYVIYKSRHQL